MTPTGVYAFLHILGVVLWMGLAISLFFLILRARRSGSPEVVAFTYRAASGMLKRVGLVGMLLTVGGGFLLTASLDYPFFQAWPEHWLFQMQLLGLVAFGLAVLYQIPLSDRLARAAEASAAAGEESAAFAKYRKRNVIVSSVVGTLLLIVLVMATLKP